MELRFSQIHVTILNFVLVGALAIASAVTVRDIIQYSAASDGDTSTVATGGRKMSLGARTRNYYDQIVKRDIFNEAPQESGPAPVVEEDLHLKLLGTSLMSRSKPYVIVEDEGGNESLYQLGEDIPDAGKLVGVENARAIIDRGGKRVAIEIPKSDMPEAQPSDLGAASAAAGVPGHPMPAFRGLPANLRHRLHGFGLPGLGASPVRPGNDSNDSKLDLKNVGPGRFEVSKAEVQQSMENPAQFFSQMRAMPHFVDGKTDGFSISQVQPGSVFAQLGLQDGDLVTSINGQPVTNPMQAMSLMQAMRTGSTVDLVVNRGGTSKSVHLDMH